MTTTSTDTRTIVESLRPLCARVDSAHGEEYDRAMADLTAAVKVVLARLGLTAKMGKTYSRNLRDPKTWRRVIFTRDDQIIERDVLISFKGMPQTGGAAHVKALALLAELDK